MKISQQKKDKISEQILAHLYSLNPRAIFTSNIAKEMARDEEFMKKLLLNLKKEKFSIRNQKKPKRKGLSKKISLETK